ncbi:MAG TPA: hypothetical protein PLU22_04080 [Polyangiaceae bacterium]|nr:hypothetical protein [Polyangiaceae bacterium]
MNGERCTRQPRELRERHPRAPRPGGADGARVRALLDGTGELAALPAALVAALDRHGFFAAPRSSSVAPRLLKLQPTNACELACEYCCTNSGAARPGELGRDAWFAIVDEAIDLQGPDLEVSLLGGEPLRVPFALELGAHALDRGARLNLFTSGPPLASPEVAGAVAALCRRGATVRVSFSGPTSASSDRRSGGERFAPTLAGLAALAARGAVARVDLMLFPDTVDLVVEELPNLRRRLPAGTPRALGLAYRGGRERGEHLFHSRHELEAAPDRIALGAGEVIPAAPLAPVTERRDACDCAEGRHLIVRSDGRLFSCFKMEAARGKPSGRQHHRGVAPNGGGPSPGERAGDLPRLLPRHSVRRRLPRREPAAHR